MNNPCPYNEAYPVGTTVRVADRGFSERFLATWKYHHKLEPEQFEHADQITTVKAVGYYHGGNPLYTLEGIPGTWHEQCLRQA